MNNIIEDIKSTDVKIGSLAIYWLGQAGFVIKTQSGKVIAIDPYLSNCCHRLLKEYGSGFKRLMPAPLTDREVIFDFLLISHDHPDHLDIDSIFNLCDNSRTKVYTNQTCKDISIELGVDISRISALDVGQQVKTDDFSLRAVFADHGELCSDALGFVLDFGFAKVYFAGDTALSLDKLSVPIQEKPEIAILPINGEFGNLDSHDAAKYAGILNSRYLIPCHFWTFPNHRGDPSQLISVMPDLAPDCELVMLAQSERFLFGES